MAGQLGVNTAEILHGIVHSQRIYEAFFDPQGRSPEKIKQLVTACKDLHDVQVESVELFNFANRPYPGQPCLNRRLDEADAYLRKHCTFEDVAQTDPSASPPRKHQIWNTFALVFDVQRAKQIHDGLMIELQKFIQFILILTLRSNFNPSGGNISSARLSGRIQAEDSTIGDIVRRLSEIRYQVERRQVQMIQLDVGGVYREFDIKDLEVELEREWRLLCLRAGFEDREQRPPLPATPRNLLLHTAQVYQDIIIAHNRDTLVSPRTKALNTSPITSPIPSLHSHGPTMQIPVLPSRPTHQSSIPADIDSLPPIGMLGDPALPICIAEFEMKPRQVLKLQTWRFDYRGDTRVLVWTGTKSANILEHHLPAGDIIPYTLHSSLKHTEKGLSLTFHGSSRIRWIKNGETKLSDVRTDLKYNFVERADFKRFQEDLRDKYLIDTLDIETVKTQHSKKRFEAVNQDLKLWCSRDGDQTYTISFFANHLKETMEFPLDWFSPDIAIAPEKRTIQLAFLDKAGSASSGRGHALLNRISSATGSWSNGSEVSMTDAPMWAAVGSFPSSPRSSISTTSSGMSSIAPSQSRIQAMAKWADKFRYINIQFSPEKTNSRDKRRKEKEDNFSRFEREITTKLSSRYPTTWTINEGVEFGDRV